MAIDDRLDHPARVFGLGGIAREDSDRRHTRRGLLESVDTTTGDDHERALLGEAPGYSAADPAAATRDEATLAL
jgi:hypothetical protein